MRGLLPSFPFFAASLFSLLASALTSSGISHASFSYFEGTLCDLKKSRKVNAFFQFIRQLIYPLLQVFDFSRHDKSEMAALHFARLQYRHIPNHFKSGLLLDRLSSGAPSSSLSPGLKSHRGSPGRPDPDNQEIPSGAGSRKGSFPSH